MKRKASACGLLFTYTSFAIRSASAAQAAGWTSTVTCYVNERSRVRLDLCSVTIALHPVYPWQSFQNPLKDRARQTMSATLKYACWRGGGGGGSGVGGTCVVMTPARPYQLLPKDWVTGWGIPDAGPARPVGGRSLGSRVNPPSVVVDGLIRARAEERSSGT